MIKTQEEYTNACNFIDSDMELYDFQLSEKMSSYEYNLYLQDTEYFLNFLYEKIRTLEELCDYLDEYADIKIEKTREEIARSLTLLDNSMDSYLDREVYVTVPVWNYSISSDLKDRNGEAVPIANAGPYKVEAAARYINQIKPLSFQADNAGLYDEEEDLEKGEYLIARQAAYAAGLVETQEASVKILIPPGTRWDHVDAIPINCKLLFKKNRNDIVITMQSAGYDKEYRPFSHDPYTGSNLHKIAEPDIRYDTTRTIAGNRRVLYDARNDRITLDYLKDVERYQHVADTNKTKARILEQKS